MGPAAGPAGQPLLADWDPRGRTEQPAGAAGAAAPVRLVPSAHGTGRRLAAWPGPNRIPDRIHPARGGRGLRRRTPAGTRARVHGWPYTVRGPSAGLQTALWLRVSQRGPGAWIRGQGLGALASSAASAWSFFGVGAIARIAHRHPALEINGKPARRGHRAGLPGPTPPHRHGHLPILILVLDRDVENLGVGGRGGGGG